MLDSLQIKLSAHQLLKCMTFSKIAQGDDNETPKWGQM